VETGTVSPEDAQARFAKDPGDPLFLHDGSDDGKGTGVSRILNDATILMEIPLPPNVSLKEDPAARSVILRRGIPTTLNSPALDPVLMLDGRQPDLPTQAGAAIEAHYQNRIRPQPEELRRIAEFQLTDAFFSSSVLRNFAHGGPSPQLPQGRTASERRGRLFFEDVAHGPFDKRGICAECHTGPMLNETSKFHPLPVPPGTRFQGVLVSEINAAGNLPRTFVFTNPDGSKTELFTPDPGRALITGRSDDDVVDGIPIFNNVNAFKIPTLRAIRRTAPYFHDNSAKTLEDVAAHYALFFAIVTDPDGPGPEPPGILITEQEQADIVAFMKLLN
jgi:cytochrome c peroxidase